MYATTSRRRFLLEVSALTLLLRKSGNAGTFADDLRAGNGYYPLRQENQEPAEIEKGKRVPFNWDYFSVSSAPGGTLLQVTGIPADFEGDILLRLMVAVDTRDRREVSVLLAKSGEKIGKIPVWYASALQLFECRLNTTASRVREEGLRLVMDKSDAPLYLVSTSGISGSHLYTYTEPAVQKPSDRFLNTFCSYRSLHPFGWMEGCSLDGLLELSRSGRFPEADKTLDRHLKLFIPDNRNLIYENPDTRPSDNRFNNLEAGLPFAAIAEKYPDHPSIRLFTGFCEKRLESDRIRADYFTTEGCYTLAYPLAAVARKTGKKELFELALLELEARIKYLTDSEAVYQKVTVQDSVKSFRNWGRGYTWFLLGLIRTSAILKQDASFSKDPRLSKIREAFTYYSNLALKHQQPDHSWRAFLDLPETQFDASATAGLGASLLYGKQIGWLPDLPDSRLYAIRQRLEQSLTPDGFLAGCCQLNRGGEELQKSSYRVISQYVMGLMAHLYAHLK